MSLSKCTNYLENRNWLKNTSGLMDTQELSSPEVLIQTTQAKKKRNNKKNPNPRFFTRLIQCLDNKEYTWMLRYVPGSCGKEFEVTFTDRKNKVWKKEDIALFVELDKYIENVFKRKRSAQKYEEAVKIRFKSNMCKCVDKFIEKMGEKKVGKCKTVKRYKILWRPGPTATDGESNDNIGSDKKPKRKSYRKGKKMDNEKICKNGTVFSTLCTSKNYEKNQNVKSQLTKEFKGLKDHHEIGYLEIQGNNIEMHSENVCQDSNADFLNLCEDYNRNILQCNPVANSQIDNKKICKNGTVFSTLCTSKNYKNHNVKSQLTKKCKGVEDHHEIGLLAIQGNNIKMHSENVCQESNSDFLNFCEDYNRIVFQGNPAANSQMEMYRNEPMDSTLENLVNLTLDEDMKIDENENMDSKITLENVPNENSDFYFDEPYLKIGNNTLGKVTFADVSNQDVQIINTFPENLDDYTIASGQKQIHTCFRNLNAYTKPEYETEINDEISQGNHFLENKFEKDVLKSNPFLCSVPKDSLKIFNSLEDQNSLEDWLGCFQPLNGMEWN